MVIMLIFVTGCTTAPWSRHVESLTLVKQTIDIHGDGQKTILEIELKSGERVRDSEFSRVRCADRIEGTFVAKVKLPDSDEYVVTPLNLLMGIPELSFCAKPWKVVTKDYDGDGRLDFNLGQYGTSNGWLYWLFAISSSGKVSVLPFFNSSYGDAMFLDDHKNSTDHIETIPGGINFNYYDNAGDEGHPWGWWQATFLWNPREKAFVLDKEAHFDVDERPPAIVNP